MGMNIVHWWNDNDMGKLKFSKKNLFQCHFAHHKSHTDRPATKNLNQSTAPNTVLINDYH